MYQSVIVITWILEELGIYNSYRNTPFFVWHIGIDIACPDDVEHSKYHHANKCGHRHSVLDDIIEKRYGKKYGSCMLQQLLMWVYRIDACDDSKHNQYNQKKQFSLAHVLNSICLFR